MSEQDKPIEMFPRWPEVRCANCAHIYEVKSTADRCPRCNSEKYNTSMAGWAGK